jgi:hypothetical protein
MEAPAVERFRSLFRGELVLPSGEGYEAVRRVLERGDRQPSSADHALLGRDRRRASG